MKEYVQFHSRRAVKCMVLLIWCISFVLFSCEDNPVEDKPDYRLQNKFNAEFNTKILNDFFVYSIAFDKTGNTWIGTFKQGIIKCNATDTILFNAANSGIPDSMVIYDIEVDSKNNIWFGCNGLLKYDGASFTYYTNENSPIPENFVYDIEIDSKDNIWFSSSRAYKGGLVKYDGKNWTIFTPDNSLLPANAVNGIAIDHNDNVWVEQGVWDVSGNYLVKISGDDWLVYSDEDFGFEPYFISDIDVNSKNEVYAVISYMLSSGSHKGDPNLFVFNGDSTIEICSSDDLSHIRYITIDNCDNIWCAASGRFVVKNDSLIRTGYLDDESVFVIEQAPDSKIWIGTGRGIHISN
ncbi:two-component regulator propeller domain-containing protein [Saccharicrinis sp. FJH2]|uniref:two-component regulator propeller domain-containing protein n=1 Tax=Saccharicrinis sp. FJH65 TaxID=3344659 RepID=UPI0035F33ACB